LLNIVNVNLTLIFRVIFSPYVVKNFKLDTGSVGYAIAFFASICEKKFFHAYRPL